MLESTFSFFLVCVLLFGGCQVIGGKDDDGGSISPHLPVYPQAYAAPTQSPDGSKLLFVRNKITRIDEAGGFSIDSDSSGIWMAESDGSSMKLLIRSLNVGTPSFSPDMKWILFELGAQIYKIPFEGNSVNMDSLVQLTAEGRNFFPDWSPDGKWIAYDSNYDSPTGLSFLWKMKNDGSTNQRIVFTPDQGEVRMPSWSFDSKKILHIRYLVDIHSSEIFSVNSDGSNSIRLIENDATDYFPKYSLDSQLIVFQSNVNIWTMDATGDNLDKLTNEGGIEPTWVYDNKIVYVNYNQQSFTKDNGTIWIMDADGSDKRQLTFNYGLELQ